MIIKILSNPNYRCIIWATIAAFIIDHYWKKDRKLGEMVGKITPWVCFFVEIFINIIF